MTLNNVALSLVTLLAYDVVFLLILVAIVALLSGTKRAAFAVMKRNFVGYFSNPTGYVFLCIFVFLTSVAAFWPYEFFNQNLATLDQLNQLVSADHAGLHSGDHDEHLGGRKTPGHGRIAADIAGRRF